MYLITAEVNNMRTVEGSYKNVLIAERHKRRLEKRYTETSFKINKVNKKNKK